MISLKEYFYENDNNIQIVPINEFVVTPVIFCLCAAVATHFSVKGMKKIKKYGNNFWDWAVGDKDIDMNMSMKSSESLENNDNPVNEDEDKKFDKNNIQPMQIPSTDILEKVINKTNPKDGKSGFYYFEQLFKDTPELKNINKKPFFPNYVVFMDPGSKDNEDEKPNFYGMLGFSQKYWSIIAKRGKTDEIKAFGEKHKSYMSIFAVQTDPKYAKQGLFEVYLNNMKKAVKETKMEGLTIKYDNNDLAEVYSKYGFQKCEDLDGYMEISFKENKEKDKEEV